MPETPACPCGETAAYACLDCREARCAAHHCAGCGRCEDHCACDWRFWIPFDF